jgi:plasmid stabilization system protein ParE/esterase/lipase
MHSENDKALSQADVRKRIGWIEIDRLPEIADRRADAIDVAFRPLVSALHIGVVRLQARRTMHSRPLVLEGLTSCLRHAADESIPPAGDGGDIPRIGRFIAQCTPQHEDALRQIGLFHDRIRPHAAHEVALLDRPAAVVKQQMEDIEGPGRHRDGFTLAEQPPPHGVESEWTESVNLSHSCRPELSVFDSSLEDFVRARPIVSRHQKGVTDAGSACHRRSHAQLSGSRKRADHNPVHAWMAGSGAHFDEVIGEIDLNALRVITLDFRGHGNSEKVVKPYDLDQIAEDVWNVADAAGVTNLVLVGFSMSGKFAQYVALRQPERVSGLVLVAGFPASEMAFPQDVVRDWVSRAGDRARLRELIMPFISEPVDAAVLDRYVDHATKVPPAALECTLQACIRASFADRVEALTMPTLIVGGSGAQ